MTKLSAIQVRNAKSKSKPYKLNDGHGLYFHVATSGKKTWRYRYKIDGSESTFVMGEYPHMSLENARKERFAIQELVKAGINPAKQRRKTRQETIEKEAEKSKAKKNSFEQVALEWIEQQRERWTHNHANAVLATLRADAFPIIGDIPVDAIQPPQVLQVIRTIEKRGALEIASKVLQRMTAVLRYAIQTGKATYNPATEMRGVLKSRKVQHRAALLTDDLPEFLKKLDKGDLHITTKLALQFVILTAARSGEVRGATWEEIDFENRLWKIPAARMKMETPHTVPLSDQAIAILKQIGNLFGHEEFVFPGIRQQSKQLSENTLLYALYRLGYHSRATVHGFRATFSTIANECGFDGDVIEKALAHEERNRVRAAYHRSEYLEQRRELMQWWANYLDEIKAGAKIVSINSAR
ncbi:MAG: tyrosine-type recombinase/integrase [Thermodesulfobacteriota bacterium]